MTEPKDKVIVRLSYSLEEAKAVDQAMACTLESELMMWLAYDQDQKLLRHARKGAMRLRQAITRALDAFHDKDKRSEYVDRMQAVSKPDAERNWQPWTAEEEAYLLESDEHLIDIAIRLGRTFRGVKEKRKKLKRRMREREQKIARKRGRR